MYFYGGCKLKSSKQNYSRGVYLLLHTLILISFIPIIFLSFTNIFHPTQASINKHTAEIVTKSFIFIEIIDEKITKTCIEETCAEDVEDKILYSASGVAIDRDKVLTAGHVCNAYNDANEIFKKDTTKNSYESMSIETKNIVFIIITDADGRKLQAKILEIDSKSDLCALTIPEALLSDVIKISKVSPEIGDHALTAAAPIGIFSSDMTLVFDGMYAGSFLDSDVYTMPCRHGSSGAPIVNEDGELIGLTYAASQDIESVNIATSLSKIRDFLHLDK